MAIWTAPAFGGDGGSERRNAAAFAGFDFCLAASASASAHLLIEIRIHDVARRRRGELAVHADVFPEHGDHDFRLVAGREADKPGVIFHVFVRPLVFVRSNLRRSGFAANIDAGNLRAHAGAAFVHHAIHAVNDLVDIFRIERPFVRLFGFRRREQQMRRTCQTPPIASPPIARASCSGVTVSAPWPIETEIVSPANHFCRKLRSFHSGEGTVPAASFGRSMPDLCAKARLMRIEGDIVDAGFVADVIEIGVAGLRDAFVQRDRPVHSPALVIVPEETRAAGALKRRVFVDAAAFESRQRHDRLERRAGRPLRLDRAIQQRIARIAASVLSSPSI